MNYRLDKDGTLIIDGEKAADGVKASDAVAGYKLNPDGTITIGDSGTTTRSTTSSTNRTSSTGSTSRPYSSTSSTSRPYSSTNSTSRPYSSTSSTSRPVSTSTTSTTSSSKSKERFNLFFSRAFYFILGIIAFAVTFFSESGTVFHQVTLGIGLSCVIILLTVAIKRAESEGWYIFYYIVMTLSSVALLLLVLFAESTRNYTLMTVLGTTVFWMATAFFYMMDSYSNTGFAIFLHFASSVVASTGAVIVFKTLFAPLIAYICAAALIGCAIAWLLITSISVDEGQTRCALALLLASSAIPLIWFFGSPEFAIALSVLAFVLFIGYAYICSADLFYLQGKKRGARYFGIVVCLISAIVNVLLSGIMIFYEFTYFAGMLTVLILLLLGEIFSMIITFISDDKHVCKVFFLMNFLACLGFGAVSFFVAPWLILHATGIMLLSNIIAHRVMVNNYNSSPFSKVFSVVTSIANVLVAVLVILISI